MDNKIKLVICGDLVPTEKSSKLFEDANIDCLIDKNIQSFLHNSDFRFFNLETPLCDSKNPIPKSGPNLIAPTKTIKGIKALNPSLIGLANNHILDQDEYGFWQTIKTLEEFDINYTGGGKNQKEAAKPFIYEQNGIKIGIYCCAENEFTNATEETCGANPFDFLNSFDDVSELSKKVDHTIVIFHGGREYYRYPSPNLQKICRKFCDKGANVVICQHSHCIGCEENYNSSKIVYGQGNFHFDMQDREEWLTSLLIQLEISCDKIDVNYFPITKNGCKIEAANTEKEKEILENFYKRSKEILEANFVKDNYKKEAEKALLSYIRQFYTLNRYAMQNNLNCEAHREVFHYGLKCCEFDREKIKNILNPIKQTAPIKQEKFIEKIFSVKNEKSKNIRRKVITILGIKMKFKKG